MRSTAENKEWSLIHNANGEWISEEHVIFLTGAETRILQIQSAKQNRILSFQQGPDGIQWCYKRELELI